MSSCASSICLALFVTLSSGCSVGDRARPQRPNIVLIYADDLGWNDLGCYGNSYHQTPAIDSLAAQGTRFDAAYSAAALCAPARASLMTGRDVLAHGIYCVNSPETKHPEARRFDSPDNARKLTSGLPTIAEVLSDAGYRTGCYGKWHLGYERGVVSRWHPLRRGFDEAIQTRCPSGKRRYFYPNYSTIPAVPIEAGTHVSDFVSQQAVAFLERDDGRPFFLYLPYFSVHGPREAKPASLAAAKAAASRPGDDAIYAAMCADLDAAVGQVLSALERLGMDQNTIVVFTSDNGAITRYDNAPFREGKSWVYDGGVRIPMLIRWPGVTAPGSVCEDPVSQLDLLPTMAFAAAAEPPAKLDGVNLSGAIAETEPEGPRGVRDFRWYAPDYAQFRRGRFRRVPMSAVRRGRFKLVYDHEQDKAALYDLQTDPGEQADLATSEPQQLRELKASLDAWLATAPDLQLKPR